MWCLGVEQLLHVLPAELIWRLRRSVPLATWLHKVFVQEAPCSTCTAIRSRPWRQLYCELSQLKSMKLGCLITTTIGGDERHKLFGIHFVGIHFDVSSSSVLLWCTAVIH